MTPIEKAAQYVMSIYKREVGYHEKATNSQLDDPLANSGSNNWNKYAAHIDSFRALGFNFYNGRKNIGPPGEWCDVFCDDGLIVALIELGFDLEAAIKLAMRMLYQPSDSCGAGCKYSADYYRAAGAWIARNGTPKVGDQIFFGKLTDESHTGMVSGVDGSYVYTIEGNANNRVEERKYARGSSNIAGYGRPDYSLIAYKFEEPEIKDDPEDQPITSRDAVEIFDKLMLVRLGPQIKEITDIPSVSVEAVARVLLDLQAVDGGTPYSVNPNDINMPYDVLRGVVIGVRYTNIIVKALEDRVAMLEERLQKKEVDPDA